MHAVCRKHAGRDPLEILPLQAGVAGKREGRLVIVGIEVVRHPLGGLSHDVDVHAVGPHPEHTA